MPLKTHGRRGQPFLIHSPFSAPASPSLLPKGAGIKVRRGMRSRLVNSCSSSFRNEGAIAGVGGALGNLPPSAQLPARFLTCIPVPAAAAFQSQRPEPESSHCHGHGPPSPAARSRSLEWERGWLAGYRRAGRAEGRGRAEGGSGRRSSPEKLWSCGQPHLRRRNLSRAAHL